jgi:hypothetical protein
MNDTVYALEQALAAAREHRIITGSKDYSHIDALEHAIKTAGQPKPLGPVFSQPAAKPLAPRNLEPAPSPATTTPITVRVTHGVYHGPSSSQPIRERDNLT